MYVRNQKTNLGHCLDVDWGLVDEKIDNAVVILFSSAVQGRSKLHILGPHVGLGCLDE
jgi:hypothetical protein